ncbi:MAG: hypothetical protein ACAI25_01430, partial [Planctomycetota bacterium]
DDWWRSEKGVERAAKGLAELDERCRATREICAIPGFEDTARSGHLGVAFVDSAVLEAILDEHARERTRGPFIGELVERGALVTINHPFAGGDRKAKLAEFGSDLSWKAWTKDAVDGDSKTIEEVATCIEVWNAAAAFGEAALGAPNKEKLVGKTLAKIDRLTLATGKRWALVGGSDNHAFWLLPTTWVRVPARKWPPLASEVREALAKGRTCAGGPEATSLEARAGSGPWRKIGDDLAADGAPIEVRFEGKGELFLDGRSLGVVEGATRVEVARGSRHHLRLVRGAACSGYIWVDWTRPAPRERVYR